MLEPAGEGAPSLDFEVGTSELGAPLGAQALKSPGKSIQPGAGSKGVGGSNGKGAKMGESGMGRFAQGILGGGLSFHTLLCLQQVRTPLEQNPANGSCTWFTRSSTLQGYT